MKLTAISLENQVVTIEIENNQVKIDDKIIGEITEKTDNRIKGTTKNGEFELIIKTK
jgi:hypothetical protein